MTILAIAILFYLPAYYIGRSKGFNASPILFTFIGMGIVAPIAGYFIFDVVIYFLEIPLSALALLVVWLLPRKEGAPGKNYMKITFNCPACKEEATFARRCEGKPEFCPKCGEIVTVPLDQYSPKPAIPKRDRPQISAGTVCFASFGDEMHAIQLKALLEAHGIETGIIYGTGGGSLPQLSGTQGFKLAIDVADWDKAMEIEKTAKSSEPALLNAGGSVDVQGAAAPL